MTAEPFDNSYEVAVWDKARGHFISHFPCPGEKRVRIDVHDALDNYAVYKARWSGRRVQILEAQPLEDWRIDLS